VRPRFACECFALREAPGGGSAYVRPLHWISRVTAEDAHTAVAWVVDRLDLLAMLLDEPLIKQSSAWPRGTAPQWWAEATLRADRPLGLDVTDSDGVLYQIAVIPVRRPQRRAVAHPRRPQPRPGGPPSPNRPASGGFARPATMAAPTPTPGRHVHLYAWPNLAVTVGPHLVGRSYVQEDHALLRFTTRRFRALGSVHPEPKERR
jgi:hypothetical protein